MGEIVVVGDCSVTVGEADTVAGCWEEELVTVAAGGEIVGVARGGLEGVSGNDEVSLQAIKVTIHNNKKEFIGTVRLNIILTNHKHCYRTSCFSDSVYHRFRFVLYATAER